MFVRVKRSGSGDNAREYLQLVESVREGKHVRQRLLLTLGRREEIVADGTLDGLVQSLAKFSDKLAVVEKVRTQGVQAHAARAWGPVLVFERLWKEQGLPKILARLSEGRRFKFDVERVCFALALQRLCAPGSDLQGSSWVSTVEATGFDKIELHHLYRAVGEFLAPAREDLERELFFHDRDLLSRTLDVVFIDTTSTYIYRDDETELRRRGYSRDRRPELAQVVLCVAVDREGWPIAWDILAGNTADTAAMKGMVEKLRKRFSIRKVTVVGDRGMISKDMIDILKNDKSAPFDYVLGCKMRRQKEVNEVVLARAGRYKKVKDNLDVKEVIVDGRRYVVCRNPDEAKKDAAARKTILDKLRSTLDEHGPKAIVGNKGFKRFIKIDKSSIRFDEDAIERDARMDGKFVLTTNTDLPTDEVALTYKSLWRVERAFRETKSTLDVRPIFHHRDDTTIGHIVACFLALRLEVDLQRRLEKDAVDVSWPDLMRDLGEMKAVELTLDGRRYRLRTDLVGSAYKALRAAGVRPPPIVTALEPPSSPA